jgi:hypothetical protein
MSGEPKLKRVDSAKDLAVYRLAHRSLDFGKDSEHISADEHQADALIRERWTDAWLNDEQVTIISRCGAKTADFRSLTSDF